MIMNLIERKHYNSSILFLLILTLISGSCSPKFTHRIARQKQIIIDPTCAIDSNIYNTILPYKDSLKKIMDQPIGKSKETLNAFKPESPLSNFVADLLLEAGIKFIEESDREQLPSVAVVNTKGLRAPLPQGEVSVRNVYEIMPFENSMVAVQLTGLQMQELFNHMVSEGGDGLAGASFTMSPPQQANEVLVQGEELRNEDLYWVFTSDYIADGGDHYTIFRKSENIIFSPYTIRDLIMKKVQELHKKDMPVETSIEIRIKKEDY